MIADPDPAPTSGTPPRGPRARRRSIDDGGAEAAPRATDLPALRCVAHNPTTPVTYAALAGGGRPPGFDAVVELRWPGWAAFDRARAAAGTRGGYLAALSPLLDGGRSSGMRVEEVRTLWPPT
jgi:hypothetical protein